MTSNLDIDIETFSNVDLKKHGVYRYCESDRFEILMASWSLDGSSTQIALGRDQIAAIPGLRDPGVTKSAHNAQFERICFSKFFGLPVGKYLPPDDWNDTAALAAEHGYPRALDALARALKVEEKDEAGTALINWFCKPDRAGKRRMPKDHPEKWAQFVAYCIQDTDTLRAVRRKLPNWPKGEREIYNLDQRINDRGLRTDLAMAARAVEVDEAQRLVAKTELEGLLGIQNAGSVPQLTNALAGTGLVLPNMRAETVDDLLLKPSLTGVQRRSLELRKEMALVAARKYLAAILMCSADGYLRGQYRFFGAHTGRWSSRGVQVHNLPRVTVKQIEEEILDLMLGFDLPPEMLKGLLRSLFIGPYTVGDFSSIEARGLAWLANESWVLDAFKAKRDIYVETAKRMSKPGRALTRQQGKVAVLALGYQGGVNSLRGMGAEGTDDELQELVYLYRDANPKIKRLWTSTERAFIEGGQVGKIRVEKRGRDRHVWLPSERALVYHGVRTTQGPHGRRIIFDDPKGFVNDTYGGRLVENVTQAICRDLLASAMINLENAGYETAGHTHDEAIVNGYQPVSEIERLMCDTPAWAAGLPVDAEVFQCARYRK